MRRGRYHGQQEQGGAHEPQAHAPGSADTRRYPLWGDWRRSAHPTGGMAGLIELSRQSNVMAAAEKCLPTKQSPKGLGQGELVKSFVVLSALGGECVDDFTQLRRDEGLAAILGYSLPAAATAPT